MLSIIEYGIMIGYLQCMEYIRWVLASCMLIDIESLEVQKIVDYSGLGKCFAQFKKPAVARVAMYLSTPLSHIR